VTSLTIHQRRTLLAVAVAALLLGGCRVDATVTVHAEPEGSGHVEVRVVLDRAAADQVPDLRVETDDLTRAGWEVTGPVRTAGGGRAIEARRSFRSPAEAERVLTHVAGNGVLRDFRLDRDRSVLKTRTRLTGAVDLRQGAAAFSDPDLAGRLGGLPLGVDPGLVAPIDQALRFTVVGDLPGGEERFVARSGQQVTVDVAAEAWNRLSIALGIAALAAAAACAVVVRRLRRARVPVRGGP
jgi:hypothetical protein